MDNEKLARIDRLIEKVREAVASERNRSRGKTQPVAIFNLEEPIASAIIFGYDANHYFSDPLFYFEQNLVQKLWRWENFPDDDAPITMDLPVWLSWYPEYTLAGLDVTFNSRGVPHIQTDHPLSRNPDIRLLKPVDFMTSGWMPRILRWYDDMLEISAGRMKVNFSMAWTRGCLDIAIQFRGYENFVADTVERPDFVHDLMKFLIEQRCRWYEAYYSYFGLPVEPVAIADDWINIPFITPDMFADFVLPRYLEIEKFHGGIISVHSCGNQAPIQKYLLEIKSLYSFENSPWTDLTKTLENIPSHKNIWVASHPNDVLCATADEMEAKLKFIVESCKGRNYGIGTSGLTPISEDIGEYISKIRTWINVVQKIREQV